MSATDAQVAEEREEWFERWFGEEYLELYPHRDSGEARRGVQTVLAATGTAPGSLALDLACGAGRHVEALRARGVEAFGLDLSEALLRRARERALPVFRADMRSIPLRTGALALVTSFFTSFGYFDDPGDDMRVLAEVRRVLALGGAFAFDYLNAYRVRRELRPRDEREVNGRRVVQMRRLTEEGRVVEKDIEIHGPQPGTVRTFHERVRLYTPVEVEALFAASGLELRHEFGDYDGSALTEHSPRVLLIGVAV